MDAVAYIEPAVINFISTTLVPLRIPADDKELGPRFSIKWTPSLLILDSQGTEHHRTLGFLQPNELIPSLLLGMGKGYFNMAERSSASSCLEKIIRDFPASFQTPEAIYLNGVSRYIEGHDVKHLVEIYDSLAAGYAKSEWLMRASPYKLLKES